MPEITARKSVFRVCQYICNDNVSIILIIRWSASLKQRCISMVKCQEKNQTSSEGKIGVGLTRTSGARTYQVIRSTVYFRCAEGRTNSVLHLTRRRIPLQVYCWKPLTLHYCNYSRASWRQQPACGWTYIVYVLSFRGHLNGFHCLHLPIRHTNCLDKNCIVVSRKTKDAGMFPLAWVNSF